jgi:hypothetical protein
MARTPSHRAPPTPSELATFFVPACDGIGRLALVDCHQRVISKEGDHARHFAAVLFEVPEQFCAVPANPISRITALLRRRHSAAKPKSVWVSSPRKRVSQ